MSSPGLPLTNSSFPAGRSGVQTAAITVTGVPGAYVVDCEVTDSKTGMTNSIEHHLDCATLDDVEDQMQNYFATNF